MAEFLKLWLFTLCAASSFFRAGVRCKLDSNPMEQTVMKLVSLIFKKIIRQWYMSTWLWNIQGVSQIINQTYFKIETLPKIIICYFSNRILWNLLLDFCLALVELKETN